MGELTDGYDSNTFAFDTRASIAVAAAAASSRSATGPPFAAGVSLDREPFVSRAYDALDARFGSDLFSSSIAAGGGMKEGSGKWGGDFGRSPCSGASYGSKAVLGSLRALQDKIRRCVCVETCCSFCVTLYCIACSSIVVWCTEGKYLILEKRLKITV